MPAGRDVIQISSGGFVEERSAQSLISNTYVENFTSPVADYGEIVQIVPGTFTLSSDATLTYTAIPEPSPIASLFTGALLLLGLLDWQRRKTLRA